MRAYLIIIFQVRQQYVTEVPLSKHNNVVKAFPSDRTDQPFGTSILPRGAWRRLSVANAHRSKSPDEDIAIGLIAIADQIVGSPFPAEGFRNLICNPFCGRMRCDAEPHDLSPAVPHDQQSIEQTKRDCRHDEQIHRGDAVGVIVEESLPSLGRRASSPGHILGHTCLPDCDAELEQLSMDPRRSPQRISNAHLADKLAYVRGYSWSATTTSRLPAPIRSETRAMPTDDRIRLDDRQRIASLGKQSIEANKYQPIKNTKGLPSRSGSPQNVDLLPKHPNLCLQCWLALALGRRVSRKSACKDRSSLGSISRFVSARQLDLIYDRDRSLEGKDAVGNRTNPLRVRFSLRPIAPSPGCSRLSAARLRRPKKRPQLGELEPSRRRRRASARFKDTPNDCPVCSLVC